MERLITTYLYHFHMTAKYLIRQDYFKLNHVMRTLYDTHFCIDDFSINRKNLLKSMEWFEEEFLHSQVEQRAIIYNKKNLERELQNESRQHNRQQSKIKRREEEI